MNEIVYLPALASHATSTYTKTVVWFCCFSVVARAVFGAIAKRSVVKNSYRALWRNRLSSCPDGGRTEIETPIGDCPRSFHRHRRLFQIAHKRAERSD